MKRSGPIKRKTPLRSKRPEPRRTKKIALAIPRPNQMRAVPKFLCDDGVFRYPDGREVCKLDCKKGMDEYLRRKRVVWEQQQKICPLCHKPLTLGDSTVDHREPRKMGGSARDDRQENIQAVHLICNTLKGSRRIVDLGDELGI